MPKCGRTFDERGNQTNVSTSASTESSVGTGNGYAGWDATYDELGTGRASPISMADEKPCLRREPDCRMEASSTSGETGKKSSGPTSASMATLPEQGRRCGNTTHLRRAGNWTSESYFGVSGMLRLGRDGFRRMEGHLRRAGKPDQRLLLRHPRQALRGQQRRGPVDGHV